MSGRREEPLSPSKVHLKEKNHSKSPEKSTGLNRSSPIREHSDFKMRNQHHDRERERRNISSNSPSGSYNSPVPGGMKSDRHSQEIDNINTQLERTNLSKQISSQYAAMIINPVLNEVNITKCSLNPLNAYTYST